MRRRVAWLYPATGLLDGHIHALAATRDADIFVFRVTADPAADLPVASLGEVPRLARAGSEARAVTPDAVAWACTAGSYIGGRDAEGEQRAALEQAAGCPATTTTTALSWALAERGVRRALVITPYTSAVGRAFCEHLTQTGVSVVAQAHAGHAEDEGISGMTTADLVALLPRTPAAADAVVLPCTGLRAEPAIPALRALTGLPVVTANVATLDHALHLVASRQSPVPYERAPSNGSEQP